MTMRTLIVRASRAAACVAVFSLVLSFSTSAHAALVHSYDFTVGTQDLVGEADAYLEGDVVLDTVNGLGLNFAGGDRNGLARLDTDGDFNNGSGLNVASYPAMTVDVWATPDSTLNDDFSTLVGLGQVSPANADHAHDYFLLQTHRGDNASRAALAVHEDGDTEPWLQEEGANGPELNDDMMHHYRAIVTSSDISLYVDGVLEETTPLTMNSLANVADGFAWIGDGYPGDQNWAGTVHRLDIYDSVIPEPTSLVLCGIAGIGALCRRRRA